MADMSIEETNRIRASIGLKPLPVPGGGPQFKPSKDDDSSSEEEEQGSTLESREAQGYGNWKKLQDDADAKAKREAKNEAIKKARDAAKKYSKLEGKGLGEADDKDDLDTKTWLLTQKKRQRRVEREKAARLEKELAERENVPEYTAADLAGVGVSHTVDDFEGGGEQILTLKDSTIDQNEEEGDELENLDLKEREALNERLSVKKKKPVYDPHAAAEGDDSSILKHYDETIDGKKRKRFTLDGHGASMEEREAMKQAVGQRLKAKPISLDMIKDDAPISDYKEFTEAKIRKPKKKKAKTTRQRAVDEDDIPPLETTNAAQPNEDGMVVDEVNGKTIEHKPKPVESTSFVDDDDLQASLAIQRRAALKKRKKTRPEDIARQLREEASATPGGNEDDGEEGEEGGMILDETTEFVANLARVQDEEKARPLSAKPRDPEPVKKEESPQEGPEDVDMDRSYNDIEDDDDLAARLKRDASTPATPGMTLTGLEDEPTLNRGLGATVSMLSQRGLFQPELKDDKNALDRVRQKFLTERQKREAESERDARLKRERERASGKYDNMSAREREEYARYENKQRDQLESRQMTEIFNREYKPDVQLKYIDEFGRKMDKKEAFKHLSHQFHGKGSGKQKTEKHLKRIDDDKKREAQSTLDASQATGMNNAMGATAKKNRVAGVSKDLAQNLLKQAWLLLHLDEKNAKIVPLHNNHTSQLSLAQLDNQPMRPKSVPKYTKPRKTHFLCLPLVTPTSRPQLRASLSRFAAEATRPDEHGNVKLSPKALRPLGAIHLTLGFMSLLTPQRVEEMKTFTRNLDVLGMLRDASRTAEEEKALSETAAAAASQSSTVTTAEADSTRDSAIRSTGTPLKSSAPRPLPSLTINLNGLFPFPFDATIAQASGLYASGLYACPTPSTPIDPFAQSLRLAFEKAGFLLPDSPSLLHATLANTLTAKPERHIGSKHYQWHRVMGNFDYAALIEWGQSVVWAEGVRIERVAVCEVPTTEIQVWEGGRKGLGDRVLEETHIETASVALTLKRKDRLAKD